MPGNACQVNNGVHVARTIMHLDMDAFYASIEQADNPSYRGKPVIVGGAQRGVVCAASYEARKYGVRSAMPIFRAKSLCPHAVYLPVRMGRYKEVSRRVMEILASISPLVECVSIDEAFVDIGGTHALHGPPRTLALGVKSKILAATGLTCSIGVAPNKFLAKIASDFNKPDGLTIIEQAGVAQFLKSLPVGKVPGVGARTAEELKKLGVVFASDIVKLPLKFWTGKFGKWGARLYEKGLGMDDSPVETGSQPKSISAEETFPRDVRGVTALEPMLLSQAEEVGRDLRKRALRGRTVTLKVKFADFKTVTRSRTLSEPFDSTDLLFDVALQLLKELNPAGEVRLIGVGISNLGAGYRQMRICPEPGPAADGRLDRALDEIRRRYGQDAVRRGRSLDSES